LIYAFGHRWSSAVDVMTEGAYFFFLFGTLWLTFRMTRTRTGSGSRAGCVRPRHPDAAGGLLAIALSLAWPAVFILRTTARLR